MRHHIFFLTVTLTVIGGTPLQYRPHILISKNKVCSLMGVWKQTESEYNHHRKFGRRRTRTKGGWKAKEVDLVRENEWERETQTWKKVRKSERNSQQEAAAAVALLPEQAERQAAVCREGCIIWLAQNSTDSEHTAYHTTFRAKLTASDATWLLSWLSALQSQQLVLFYRQLTAVTDKCLRWHGRDHKRPTNV